MLKSGERVRNCEVKEARTSNDSMTLILYERVIDNDVNQERAHLPVLAETSAGAGGVGCSVQDG